MSTPIRIVVTGAAGRMGSLIVRLIHASHDMKLAAALEKPGHPALGRDAGEIAGIGRIEVHVEPFSENILKKASVLVDFSHPESTMELLEGAKRKKIPMVIGTTGISDAQKKKVKDASKIIPIVMSPNMSLGVNLMFKIVADTSRVLKDGYDIEILEAHHRMKKDAPSGTALRLAESVAAALKRNLKKDAVYQRKGNIGARKPSEIGIQVIRAGDIVGEHTVLFGGPGEILEITHRATSREAFARGALSAVRWILKQVPGLYDMSHVLGLADQ